MQKQGTHGTCISCAESIEHSGFKMSTGRGGIGVYFWRDSKLAADLARGWYEFYFSKGKYREFKNSKCAILYVTLNAAEDEILDLEDPEIKDQLYELMEKLDILPHPKDEEIATAHDLFVRELEKTINKNIKILELRVGLPKDYFTFYELKALGAPICYIARDSAIIAIDSVEKS